MHFVYVYMFSSISKNDAPVSTTFGINVLPFETTSTSQFLSSHKLWIYRVQDTSSSKNRFRSSEIYDFYSDLLSPQNMQQQNRGQAQTLFIFHLTANRMKRAHVGGFIKCCIHTEYRHIYNMFSIHFSQSTITNTVTMQNIWITSNKLHFKTVI